MAKRVSAANTGGRRADGATGNATPGPTKSKDSAVAKRAEPASQRAAAATAATGQDIFSAAVAREQFWHNVVREMLTSLSVLQGTASPEVLSQIFDGRIAVLTHGGERIPIGEVTPLFAIGLNGTSAQKAASRAVECTVFRLRTPAGEEFTLPLHEIRCLHSLSEDLMKRIEQRSIENPPADGAPGPFGFAAFITPKPDPAAPPAPAPHQPTDAMPSIAAAALRAGRRPSKRS